MSLTDVLITLGGLVWGFIVKHHPAWKGVPNALIPYFSFALAFVVHLAAPATAHAATFAALPFVAPAAGILGHALSAGWQAILNSLIYETFLRKPSEAVLSKP